MRIKSALICLLTSFLADLYGSNLEAGNSGTFFESHDEIKIVLEAPINSLKKQRGDELEWLEAVVKWEESGEPRELDVKIRARGKFRRQRSTCSFPPYWINFKKSQVKGTLFDGLDKVKVVSHCRDGFSSFEPYIYKEYLCYRTYNLMTEKSFRVRLARIVYKDMESGRSQTSESHVAFFIEHVESLEKRMDAIQVKDKNVLPSVVSQEDLCRAELFQFFVGNTDFSFFSGMEECCHNGKVFAPVSKENGLIPVPYDFDMSGIVNTPYSVVDPHFPNLTVIDRHYRGMGVSREILQDTIMQYVRKKERIYALWRDSGLISGAHLKRSLKYIDEFYDILRTKKKRKREIIRKLRSMDALEKSILESMEEEGISHSR